MIEVVNVPPDPNEISSLEVAGEMVKMLGEIVWETLKEELWLVPVVGALAFGAIKFSKRGE